MSNITLYRGDYDKIKNFLFSKTNKYCYRGQGIYLTDHLELAETYRTKGSSNNEEDNSICTLCSGTFKTKEEALDRAFGEFLKESWNTEKQGAIQNADQKKLTMHRVSLLGVWEDLLRNKTIQIEKSTPLSRDSNGRITSSKLFYFRINWHRKILRPGRVTEFHFDKTEFENRIVHTDIPIRQDKMVFEYLFSNGLFMPKDPEKKKKCINDKSQYLCYHTNSTLNTMVAGVRYENYFSGVNSSMLSDKYIDRIEIEDRRDWNQLIPFLKKIGKVGFEYIGGANTRGKIHRAFSIWDEGFVNSAKVRAFR